MYTKKAYDCVLLEEQPYLCMKGALDRYDVSTVQSTHYKNWVTTVDEKTCFACRSQNGQMYEMGEIAMLQPPLHSNCCCQTLPMEAVIAGNATKDRSNGADWWLKYFGVLPDYYITEQKLKKLRWDYGKRPPHDVEQGNL